MTREPYPLGELIARDGVVEYVRDRYLAANGYLHMPYTAEYVYIAEDGTYQPWLSVMGDRPAEVTRDFLRGYLEDDRYIAVCTNSEAVAAVIASNKRACRLQNADGKPFLTFWDNSALLSVNRRCPPS